MKHREKEKKYTIVKHKDRKKWELRLKRKIEETVREWNFFSPRDRLMTTKEQIMKRRKRKRKKWKEENEIKKSKAKGPTVSQDNFQNGTKMQ